MPIPSDNFAVAILLSEVDLNCQIILRAVARLRRSAQHWTALCSGIDDGGSAPPIDIVGDCSMCLSSAASIFKLLRVGDRRGPKKKLIALRCTRLNDFLGDPPLTHISDIAVRNAWEHLDERLDEVLATKRFRSVSEVHVAVDAPAQDTFVNRWFDPVALAIRHANDIIPLEPLAVECQDLLDRVSHAYQRLQTERCDPYAP